MTKKGLVLRPFFILRVGGILMKVLVLGSGGREHSMVIKLSESPLVEKIFSIPGNPGIAELAETASLPLSDQTAIVSFVKRNKIDLTLVGPEVPLTEGIVNRFEQEGLLIFGPSKEAAELESSKAFSKDLMRKYKIPTAEYRIFRKYEDAADHLRSSAHPIVVKASGLAAGKGAVVCNTLEESLDTIRLMMVEKCFKEAADEVVIEEFMTGEEASVFAVCDGKNYKILVPAQDHKAVYDGDKGPNTGGMGSYAPAPVIGPEMMREIEKNIVEPTIIAMKEELRPFKGVLFVGLMITKDGPKVIEYNCRFGDPETQVVLPLYEGDFAELAYRSAAGKFEKNEILPSKSGFALCLVLASGGYPGKYTTGYPIAGAEGDYNDVCVIHAGTAIKDGTLITSGGRVLNVVAKSPDLKSAKDAAYRAAERINFKDKYFRNDIGDKGIARLES
jgi:phosphoribosylamine---glycine ligase